MSHPDRYHPKDDFRQRLEETVVARYRAGEWMREAERRRRATWAKAAGLAGLSLALGVTAGLASAQIGARSARDSILSAAQADFTVASIRRDLARAQADNATKQFNLGMIGRLELSQAEGELAAMEMQRNRIGLNLEEINASGHAPRDELNAPLVGGRDFVKQRIELEAASAQRRLRAAEEAQSNADMRVRMAAAPDQTRLAATEDLARARGELSVLATKLELRAEFLTRGTPIEELARRLNAAQLKQDAYVLQQTIAAARERLDIVERAYNAGAIGEVELLRARLDLKTREAYLQKVAQQLRSNP